MPVDIILYAVIAAGLVLWLRSLLGMRQDGERQRPNPFAEAETGQAPRALPPSAASGTADPAAVPDDLSSLDRNMAIHDRAQAGLKEIFHQDKTFDVPHFLRGAQDAFVMIVEAFASGDRETLKNLLSDRVYQSFNAALDARSRSNEQVSMEIHAVRKAEVVAARMEGRSAHVTVRFVADETNVVRAADGTLISGHPDRVTETIDIWTFTRDIKSRDPSWLLTETREEHAGETGAAIVPDANA